MEFDILRSFIKASDPKKTPCSICQVKIICIPCLAPKTMKLLPCSAAHTPLDQIREFPPPPAWLNCTIKQQWIFPWSYKQGIVSTSLTTNLPTGSYQTWVSLYLILIVSLKKSSALRKQRITRRVYSAVGSKCSCVHWERVFFSRAKKKLMVKKIMKMMMGSLFLMVTCQMMKGCWMKRWKMMVNLTKRWDMTDLMNIW